MNDNFGMIGTLLALRRERLAAESAAKLDALIDRSACEDRVEVSVESRPAPVHAYCVCSRCSPPAVPEQSLRRTPPSWDPLGVAPYLWDQLPDLPDTPTRESAKSSSRLPDSPVDAGLVAAAPMLSRPAAFAVSAAAVVSWAAPTPLDLVMAVVCAVFLTFAALLFSVGAARAVLRRPARNPAPSRRVSVCDACYEDNVFASLADIRLCASCRRGFPLPGWAWEYETAASRDRMIAGLAYGSIRDDRKVGRLPYGIAEIVEREL